MGGPDPLHKGRDCRSPFSRRLHGSTKRSSEVLQSSSLQLVSAEEVAAKRARRSQASTDYILLSFFDGLGSAALILDSLCKETNKTWRAITWEVDRKLVNLVQEHFPHVDNRGDVDDDNVDDILKAIEEIDPTHEAHVIITGGPPCHDYSRLRAAAPGKDGPEGSKFVRFANLVRDLEKRRQYPQATLLVENVVPSNKADVRLFERLLSAQATLHDASDFGVISRPRVWWSRIPWQELSHKPACPFRIRWTTQQGLPRAQFNVDQDSLADYDLDGLTWPSVVIEDKKILPCLTTPSDTPGGRPAPRSSKGKVSSDTQQRWLQDGRRFAPWHYEQRNLFRDRRGQLVLATAEIKEQMHHLPKGWTRRLDEHSRHKAIANGWHIGSARIFLMLCLFAAECPVVTVGRELSPLGGNAIDSMRTLWESSPLLSGPGVPTSADSFDLSDIDDPWLHWQCAEKLVHEGQTSPQLEPGLAQWLPLWRHWRLRLPEIRASVAAEIAQLVSDSDEEIREWFCARAPHVQSAYGGTAERCTVKVPIIKRIAKEFGWADMALFDELDNGFPLLGPLRPGLGWRTRQDARYASPTGMNEFLSENRKVVKRKLRSCKVDPCWEVMAKEIADDVLRGRMEGPFSAPPEWNKTFVPLANFEHTAKLLPGPQTHVPCCFAFAVHQTGSDGQPKVRRAEDWKRSGANGTVGVDDTPCYHDISAFVALAKTIRKVVPDETVQIWGVDHESAYRQLPVEEPEHTYVILQTPYGPTLWRHTVLMFGSTASVWSYCRVADLMTWLSRSLLLVPLLHFVDDFGSCETEITANSAFQCTQDVCSQLGVKFKESKAQPPAQRHVIQGVELELSHDLAQIKCTPERRTRMDCVLLQMLLDDTLKPAEAAAVAGKLQFIAKSLFGKASAAAIRPFYQRASADWLCKLQKGWKLNAALKSAIAFLRHCFRHPPPRSVRFQAAPRSVIYADAFFQLGEQLFKIKDADAAPDWGDANPAAFLNGWGFVAKVGEKVMYASGFVPFWFVRHFASRRSYIYMLEIVAQILPLYALVKDLDPYCIMFVDNEPARHALRKGYGRDEHINRLVQTAWLWIERCGMVPQWQRVMSSANISDAVSRGDFREAERQGWTRLHVDWDNIFAALLDQCLDGPFRWAEG